MDGHQTKGTVIPFTSMPGLLAFDGDEASAPAAPAASSLPSGMEDFLMLHRQRPVCSTGLISRDIVPLTPAATSPLRTRTHSGR